MRLLALAALALALGGCSLRPEAPKEIPPAPVPPQGANRGKIGDAIRLAGSEAELRVQVIKVIDPLPVGPGDKTLRGGARFAGVELELTNVGKTSYSESPLSDSKLLTEDGMEAAAVTVVSGPCGGRFALHAQIAPGQKSDGCVVFEVPRGRRPSTFRFALDSGFADEVGEWNLK